MAIDIVVQKTTHTNTHQDLHSHINLSNDKKEHVIETVGIHKLKNLAKKD